MNELINELPFIGIYAFQLHLMPRLHFAQLANGDLIEELVEVVPFHPKRAFLCFEVHCSFHFSCPLARIIAPFALISSDDDESIHNTVIDVW